MAQKWTHVATSERTLHTGSGRLAGLILSHGESSAQSVTVYDAVSSADAAKVTLAVITVAPQASPAILYFEPDYPFSRGLVIVPGNCSVQVLSYGS